MAKKNATPAATEQTPAAVIVTTPSAPVQKRGNSTVATPVAIVWTLCINAVAAAFAAGEPVPARKVLVNASIAAGVSYYTARTQVQAYLKASKGGKELPAKLPRNVGLAQPTA